MVTLIIGVPDSGKSILAEGLAVKYAGEHRKYYIATMVAFDEKGRNRIEKHRNLRKGKGFYTLECPVDVHSVTDSIVGDATVLLECMSNLIGNEIYAEKNREKSSQELQEEILTEIRKLRDGCENLVIVTNEFPLQDSTYDNETRYYVSMIHEINLGLRELSQEIYEYTEGEWIRHEIH